MPISLSRAEVFCEGLDHPECVAVHPDGSVWAGGEGGQVYRVSSDGRRVDEVANTGGFNLGIAFAPGAQWLAICDLGQRCVWRLDPRTGRLEKFADRAGQRRFAIPNHLAFTDDGSLYVTDSGHFRQVDGVIYRFDAEGHGKGRLWHAGPFNFANGIAVTPDQSAVVLCCTWLPGVERVFINADGSAGRRQVYAKLPRKALPDGLAFDARGRLYVGCYTPSRIYTIAPGKTRRERKVAVLIDDWEAHTMCNPTNVAFGGPEMKHLFTANLGRWHLTRIDLRAAGHPLPSHRYPG